jgi:hypothetical protein
MPARCETSDSWRPGLRIAARSKDSKDNARSVGCIPRLYSNLASHCYVCVRSYCHWTTIYFKVTPDVIMTYTLVLRHISGTLPGTGIGCTKGTNVPRSWLFWTWIVTLNKRHRRDMQKWGKYKLNGKTEANRLVDTSRGKLNDSFKVD